MNKESTFHRYDRHHRRGEVVSCKVSKIVSDIGLFVELAEGVEGIVHLSDFDRSIKGEELLSYYVVGQKIEAIILAIEPELERVCLGIKQHKPRSDLGSGTDPHTPSPVTPKKPKRPNLSLKMAEDD